MFGSRSFWGFLLVALSAIPPFLGCSTSPGDDSSVGGRAPSTTGGAGTGGSAGLGGEGGETGAPLSACDQLYESFHPEGAPNFQQDVLPILREKCSAGVCHGGKATEAQGSLWLGRPADQPLSEEEVEFIYRSLMDVQAVAAPKLALVRPNRPRDSWLMLKLDSCLQYSDLNCALPEDPACGERMPNIGDELPEASRALIRSWIATGAAYK